MRSDRTGLSEPRDLVLRRGRGPRVRRWPCCSRPAAPARSCSTPARLFAAAAAVYGILRNQPRRRGVWQLFALGLALFAAGDVVFDVAQRAFGRADGYPYADILYLARVPRARYWLLVRLARALSLTARQLVDSAIVAVAVSAVIWQWVVTPVIESTNGATLEHLATIAYPLMDILLVVVIVHAVFTLPRWSAAVWLLFIGLGVHAGRLCVVRAPRGRRHVHRRRRARRGPRRSHTSCSRPRSCTRRCADSGKVAMPGSSVTGVPACSCSAARARSRSRAIVLLDDSGSSTSVVLAAITGVALLGRLAHDSRWSSPRTRCGCAR